MPSPIRVVVPIDCHDPSAWAYALAYAQRIGTEAQPPTTNFVLLTHTKQQLSHTSLGNHVGAAQAKALIANREVRLQGSGVLRHATLQTLRGSGRQAVIIAYFAEDKMMETIDGLVGVTGVVAVPEFSGEVDTWSARWTPIVHGQQPAAPAVLISDTVVEKALAELSRGVNLSHALMNPRDKGYANETLRILRANSHVLEPDKIKSWAIKNGWRPGAADELAKLAGKIRELKSKPSTKEFHNADGKYHRWNN